MRHVPLRIAIPVLAMLFAPAGSCAHRAGSGTSLAELLMAQQAAADQAESDKDFAALDRLLADTYTFTAPTGAVSTKSQLIEDIRRSDPDAAETLAYDDVRPQLFENTAIMNFRLSLKSGDNVNGAGDSRYRYTVVWIRERETWRMAAVHVSRIRS